MQWVWVCQGVGWCQSGQWDHYERCFSAYLPCYCCSLAKSSLTLCDPMAAADQASLSFTLSWSMFRLMTIESMMPSNHLILCCPLLLLPSVFPSIMVFSNESALHIKWPKYWSFSFSISPSNEYPGLISSRIDLFPCHPRDSQEPSPATQFESINFSTLSLLYGPTLIYFCQILVCLAALQWP